MRLLLCLAGIALFAASAGAQAPDYPLDTKPAPGGGVWIGWDEIPCMYVPELALPTPNIEVVPYDSPVVPVVLDEIGIHAVHLHTKAGRALIISSSVPTLTLTKSRWALPRVALLAPRDQTAIMSGLLSGWTQFYSLVGSSSGRGENHFSKERAALVKRAEKEGITSALLKDCESYRSELEVATAQTQ